MIDHHCAITILSCLTNKPLSKSLFYEIAYWPLSIKLSQCNAAASAESSAADAKTENNSKNDVANKFFMRFSLIAYMPTDSEVEGGYCI